MPMIQARVRNIGRLQHKVKGLDDDIKRGVIEGLTSLREPIKNDIKRDLRREKSGPVTTRYRPQRVVRVSMPGEAPARDTGKLERSIQVDVDPTQFNMVLSANDSKARELEYGTRYMLARPFLRPALTRWRERIINAIHLAIKGKL